MYLREKARELILNNFKATGEKYIAPSWPHYKQQWLWDSCFHAMICAELGLQDLAKNEIENLLKWQQPEGWIPHTLYHKIPPSLHSRIEWNFFKKAHRKFHSSHTQPPVLAQAIKAINDARFTQDIFPELVKFYLYFQQKRDPDNDGLISIFHPCEARDVSPEFLELLPKFKGLLRFLNIVSPLRYFLLAREYQKLNWDIEKIWQKNLFNVEDLMFHCIWVEGLRTLIGLSLDAQISQQLKGIADRAEQAVFESCWDKREKIFYSLDSQHRKLKPVTISNLFPLILDNLPKPMAEGLIEHLTNPQEFWTPYPIPCVSLKAGKKPTRFGTLFRLWNEPTVWINTNWFILRGLVRHGYADLARHLSQKTIEMVEREGFWECYHPFTGKGLRRVSRNFGWSGLVVTFPKILNH